MSLPLGMSYSVPFEEYRDDPGLNQSTFDAATPAHLLHAMGGGIDTPTFRMGRALHCAILEPGEFGGRVIVRPKFSGDGSRSVGQSWDQDHADWLVLSAGEMADVVGMAAGIRRNPETRRLVEQGFGHSEATCIWVDAATGVRCKARVDRFIPGVLALDVKTTRSAAPRDFEWAFTSERGGFGYARQLAWYRRGLIACGQPEMPWTVVAVENEPPYEAAAYVPEPDFLTLGANDAQAALTRIAGWLRANEWHGYAREIVPLLVPEGVRHRRRSELQ